MSSGIYDPIVPKQEAKSLSLCSERQVLKYHYTGKIVAMN
jgi:hypothetical protein